jgi:hypothetical protein
MCGLPKAGISLTQNYHQSDGKSEPRHIYEGIYIIFAKLAPIEIGKMTG